MPPTCAAGEQFYPSVTCSKYYQCSNGLPILRDCPATLEFNPVLDICELPETANCANNINYEKPPTCIPNFHYYLPSKNCSNFFECLYGKAILQNCPSTLEFNFFYFLFFQQCVYPKYSFCSNK